MVNGQKPEARSQRSDVVPACGGVPFQARSGDAIHLFYNVPPPSPECLSTVPHNISEIRELGTSNLGVSDQIYPFFLIYTSDKQKLKICFSEVLKQHSPGHLEKHVGS
ncbi:hypothetical protein ACN38_g10598 [Penicillium nordicum]|uniref:Uncharacterized protein n=1 Tax=Penicillium nordicum TaxID=229535 RepID=A0A0N0RXW1_9EURO|nr:hypothetical protein ACN38_g10598 [Penicillium nordicum]